MGTRLLRAARGERIVEGDWDEGVEEWVRAKERIILVEVRPSTIGI